ncbi:DUF2029 domain-containing protein [candidate division KSB1 bacterium]|nr:DUF2029 domain-containing protein [candidate division KSB1 bacterium]
MEVVRRPPPDWLLIVALLTGLFLWQRTVFPLWMVDLFHIQYASYEWKQGELQWMYTSIEDTRDWEAHRAPIAAKLGAEGWPNEPLYPPFLHALLSPFADADAASWMYTVFAMNLLLLPAFALIVLRACEVRCSMRSILWGLALVMVCYPMARATKLGQIGPLLVAITWLAILALRRSRQVFGGILLGIVGALKIFPLSLLLAPLLLRRFRFVTAALVTVIGIYAISLFALGLEVHGYWWKAITKFGNLVWPFFGNQSLAGWFVRLTSDVRMDDYRPVLDTRIVCFRLAAFGGCVVAILPVAMRIWRKSNSAAAIPLIGLVMGAVLLLLPTSWEHYWLWMLPVLGWAIHREWCRQRHSATSAVLLGVAAFFFLMKLTRCYGESMLGRLISGSQTIGLTLLVLWLLLEMRRMADPSPYDTDETVVSASR